MFEGPTNIFQDVVYYGAFTTIHKKFQQGKQFAVKIIDKFRGECCGKIRNIEREVKVLSCLKQKPKPYLVKVKGLRMNNRYHEIEMDYYQYNLKQFLIRNWHVCDNNVCIGIKIFLNILYGRIELEQSHRDLKPENIAIMIENQDPKAVLLDFGQAKQIIGKTDSFVGTQYYYAPEIHEKQGLYDEKVDVFSLGTILYQIFHGINKGPRNRKLDQLQLPFMEGQSSVNQYYENAENNFLILKKRLPKVIKQLTNKMLKFSAKQRLELYDVFDELLAQFKTLKQLFPQDRQEQLQNEFMEYYQLAKKQKYYARLRNEQFENKVHRLSQLFTYIFTPLQTHINIEKRQYYPLLELFYGCTIEISKILSWFYQECELKQNTVNRFLQSEKQEKVLIYEKKLKFAILRKTTTLEHNKKYDEKYYQKIDLKSEKYESLKSILSKILSVQYTPFIEAYEQLH